MTDLRDDFEAAFDVEPPLRPTQSAVKAGRQALRRRRLAAGAAALGVVAAVGLGASQLRDEPSAQPTNPAEHPDDLTLSELEQRLTELATVDSSWRDDCGLASQPTCEEYLEDAAPVSLARNGRILRVTDEVIIVRQADDTTPPEGSRRSAVEVRTPDSVHPTWWLLTRSPDGKVTAELSQPSGSISFQRWARAANNDRIARGSRPSSEVPVIID